MPQPAYTKKKITTTITARINFLFLTIKLAADAAQLDVGLWATIRVETKLLPQLSSLCGQSLNQTRAKRNSRQPKSDEAQSHTKDSTKPNPHNSLD